MQTESNPKSAIQNPKFFVPFVPSWLILERLMRPFSLSYFLTFSLLLGCISETPDLPPAVTPDQFPAAPTQLEAPYAGWNYVELIWQDNSRNENGFTLERRFPPSVQWQEIKLLPQDSTHWFDEEGIGELTTCDYRVSAFNDAGVSSYSNEASATTQLAAPTELMAVALSAYRIELKWIDNSEKEDGFEIEGMLRDSVIIRARVAANTTTFSDSGRFKPNTTYRFIIRAFRGDVFSETSDVASATTLPIPPAAPSNLTAEAVSSSQINLAWRDNSDNEDGFKIERTTVAGGSWTQIGQTGAGVNSFRDADLASNTIYIYRLRAFNTAGNSAYSNEASATTNQVPPAAPSNLTAEAVSATQINLAWTDNSETEDGFRIECWTSADVHYEPIEVAANVTHYENTGLQPNTIYTYRILAFNGAGNSDYSNEASDTTNDIIGAIPAAPSNLVAEAASSTQINLGWADNSDNEDGFRIEYWTSIDVTHVPIEVAAGVTSYQHTGLQPNTTYTYRVMAYNSAGNSAYSNEASATTPREPLAAPSNLRAEAVSSRQINLTWDDNSNNEDGFKVERKTGAGGVWSEIRQTIADITSYGNSGLASNTTYYYRVLCFNAGGNSAYSNEASATTTPIAGDERDFPLGDTTITMVWIPPGSFMMGSPGDELGREGDEGPVHRVTFASGFWMGKYELTQQQWTVVMGSNPASDYGVGDNYPVYNVSWNDIQNFESALGNEFRLPSESEWEYACRAGTTARFYWGDDPSYIQIGNYAWYDGNSGGSTHLVGQKTANNWNLYDMAGNVLEWCEDRYHYNYNGAPTDGSSWAGGDENYPVLRVGSFANDGRCCRSADRSRNRPIHIDEGFRLVCNP
jgi:formylglycine-generating enzyme required for sulfatase activity